MPPRLHPFSEMLSKLRSEKKKGGGFANLSERQQWQFHADVYAFRHIVLDMPAHVRVSPVDPEGKFYNDDLVLEAVEYYHEKFVRTKVQRRKSRDDDLQREGRDIVNRWARGRGYVDLDDMADRLDKPWVDLYREYLDSPEFKEIVRQQRLARGLNPE
jgi:hypothetical protein